jgi:hypothetical protein
MIAHGWYDQGTVLETATDQDALMAGRYRERRALDNENYGRRVDPGVLTDRRDALLLRGILASYGRVFPAALPAAEPLASV